MLAALGCFDFNLDQTVNRLTDSAIIEMLIAWLKLTFPEFLFSDAHICLIELTRLLAASMVNIC